MPLTPVISEEPRGKLVPVDNPIDRMLNPANDPEQQLREKEAVAIRTGARRERENFVRQNVQQGIPMDVDAELPSGLRARVSFESNIDKQVDLISKRPEVLGARKSKDGRNVIVRVAGEDGKPKDVLLHPKTPTGTLGDVAGATAPILKTVPLAGAAIATGGMSLLPTAAIMGGAGALTEVASSGGSRLLAGQDIDPKELALAAGKEGVINAALPLAAGAVSGAVKATGNALRKGAGELERRLPLAAGRLGVDTTAAETTGSPLLAKVGKLTATEESERQARLGMAKDRAFGPSGPSGVLSEEDVAAKVQPIFSDAERAAEKVVRSEMTAAEKAAQVQIQAELDSGLIPTTRTTSEVGDFIRTKIAGKTPDSKASLLRKGDEELFSKVNDLATTEGLVVQPTAVQKLASELTSDDKKALLALTPGVQKIPTVSRALTEGEAAVPGAPTGLVDEFERLIMGAGTPAKDAPPLTLRNARELRAAAYELANTPGAPGQAGATKSQLMRLYRALDDDMNAAVKSGSKELQAANDAAETFHKTNVQPLQQSDVSKLFLETDAAGRLGGDEVVRRLFRGEGNLDALRAYRNVLGKDSPEWKLLVRQGMQTVMDDAAAGAARIDAGKFLSRIESLSKSELADEILGPIAKTLRANATLMKRAQGAKIPEDELIDAMGAAPGRIAGMLERAIAREETYNRTYNSTIQKQLRDGVLGPRTMGSVDDFVTRFVENASVTDVRQALTQIAAKSPQAAEDIRQRVLKNVLDAARAKPPMGKATTGEVEDMSVGKLLEYTEGLNRDKYKAILGEKGVQFLDDLATYAEATTKRIAGEQGRKVSPETVVKEGVSGAIGFKRNLVGALVDVGATVTGAKKAGAVLSRNPSVKRFIETGVLPSFDEVVGGSTLRPVLAAPQVLRAKEAVEGEKKDAPPPKKTASLDLPILTPAEAKTAPNGTRFVGSNGKIYEKNQRGKISVTNIADLQLA